VIFVVSFVVVMVRGWCKAAVLSTEKMIYFSFLILVKRVNSVLFLYSCRRCFQATYFAFCLFGPCAISGNAISGKLVRQRFAFAFQVMQLAKCVGIILRKICNHFLKFCLVRCCHG